MSLQADRAEFSYRRAGRRIGQALGYESIAYIAAFVDFAYVLAASMASVFLYHYFAFGAVVDAGSYFGIGLITAAIFVLAMSSMRGYRQEELTAFRRQSLAICAVIPTVIAFVLTVIFFLKLGQTFSRVSIMTHATTSILGLVAIRYVWHRRLPVAVASGFFRPRKALLVCPQTSSIENFQSHAEQTGLIVKQVVRQPADGSLSKSFIDTALRSAAGSDLDEVIVMWRDGNVSELQAMLVELRRLPLTVKVIFDDFTGSVVSCLPERIAGNVAFMVQRPPLSRFERGVKRAFDIGFSATALLLLSPILIAVAIAVSLDSRGPIFFLQSRKGHGSQPFKIFKFRSMTVMEDGSQVRQATKDDDRVTRVGALIRAASIDELPQFWNVLRGEMSVVGPRPHAVAHDDIYDKLIDDYAFRRHVKPGLTGWAQINGSRGETPTVGSMEQRVVHDLWYIDNWSLWLDVRIVLRTLFIVHKGA